MASTHELLARDEEGSDDEAAYGNITRGKTIAVTGAGGSIGRALCRLIVKHKPGKLIMIDSSERSLFEADSEIAAIDEFVRQPVLADIRDLDKMKRLFRGVDAVYHCAALKHVALCEKNADEAVWTNVMGSWAVHEAARANAAYPILISSDKAVQPVSVMGITKAAAEGIWGGPVVRLVNVLWSSGSLLPIVADKLVWGRPVTIRGRDTERYFMTESEAARTIMAAHSYRGITVPVLGGPTKIVDLIQRLATQMNRPVTLVDAELPPSEKAKEVWAWPYEKLDLSGPATAVSMPLSGKKLFRFSEVSPMIDAARLGPGNAAAEVERFARTALNA